MAVNLSAQRTRRDLLPRNIFLHLVLISVTGCSQLPQGCSTPRHTDWPTVSRKVTSTSTNPAPGSVTGPRCSCWIQIQEYGVQVGGSLKFVINPAVVRPSSNCEPQTRPFVREGATHQQTRNYEKITKTWSWVPGTKTNWPTGSYSQQLHLQINTFSHKWRRRYANSNRTEHFVLLCRGRWRECLWNCMPVD
jgi:hypothetical protein